MKWVFGLSVLAFVVLAVAQVDPTVCSRVLKTIPNSYIIVFKKGLLPEVAAQCREWVKSLHQLAEQSREALQFPGNSNPLRGLIHTYEIGDMVGYSGQFADDVIQQVRQSPNVSSITQLPTPPLVNLAPVPRLRTSMPLP